MVTPIGRVYHHISTRDFSQSSDDVLSVTFNEAVEMLRQADARGDMTFLAYNLGLAGALFQRLQQVRNLG
ncbi:hypothetical protein GCM10011383_40510 [Hymenobacter cavernae]|uniref:Uncharacterized protein n=1 Tax=Hymenobacter cavernae TaxID=2044852 RepID=A0ABQ1UTJ2_9BACT|nr:hypothetical protein GCM10011383_40510 [Hymenobacter cavernae]